MTEPLGSRDLIERPSKHWFNANRIRSGPILLIVLCLAAPLSFAFDAAAVQQLLTTNSCDGCDLSNSDLARTNLSKANLHNANLFAANLSHANLTDANLAGANLQACNLEGSILVGVDLSSVRLTGANLRNADVSHLDVDFDLEFVELVGVALEGAHFKNGVRCGPFPAAGGWGCAAQLP